MHTKAKKFFRKHKHRFLAFNSIFFYLDRALTLAMRFEPQETQNRLLHRINPLEFVYWRPIKPSVLFAGRVNTESIGLMNMDAFT